MIILAIETSCDDTAIALVKVKQGKRPKFQILSNVISSQVKLHQKYGGVYPSLAKREHLKNLPVVFEKAKKEAKNPKLDLIAVTIGPGLEPCLWTGINFAKDIAQKLNLPLIPVNHIEAHILTNFINGKLKNAFPAVCLVVSGGHTQLILMKDIGKYEILGETRDDAAGECFDKTARILGLGYPGGPVISKLASSPDKNIDISLPRPMMHQKNYDFSFSGLKTAVLYNFRTQPHKVRKSKEYIKAVARETQQAVIDVLIYKTLKAAKNFKARTIILGGGVTANKELRKQFKKRVKKEIPHSKLCIPDSNFCTDNAAMTAVAGYFNYLKGLTEKPGKVEANANLRVK